MALSASALGAAINAKLGITDAGAQASMLLLADAIVTYLVANAAVTVSTTASAVATIVAPPTGGPCTGALAATGTGKIS